MTRVMPPLPVSGVISSEQESSVSAPQRSCVDFSPDPSTDSNSDMICLCVDWRKLAKSLKMSSWPWLGLVADSLLDDDLAW